MKHARVIHQGRTQDAQESDGMLLLEGGERVALDAVRWLPPLTPVSQARTILCLGLNYADHAKELAFKPPSEPLAFLKGQSSLIGHRERTQRPPDVKFMHYECELAVIIGRTAKNVKQDDAYEFVEGYTVANDYAIRDYLENWYRPNLKVKGRPTCTPLGPWRVDAKDIANPMNLNLQTTVNGQITQRGNTRDMIFSIPALIEYFTSFMTLRPGDLILTGTPDGVADCPVGTAVECAIEGLGTLKNTLIALES
jgi:5-oxopent-3-ene-1,2,5-tricarboxylate decarboxylase / 2-hydroxyhepta-2,4-diene-1,7-dioate isomerase